MSKIGPTELEERLDGETPPTLVDIRPRDAYQRDHIDGSRNVPVYHDLQRGDDAEFRRAIASLPDDRAVVTVCVAGVVARKATAILQAEGYEAYTLAGGMRRWNGYRDDSLGYRLRSALAGLLP